VVLVVLEEKQAIAFLNAELKRLEKPPIATEPVVDTLVLARRKAPRRTEHSIVVGLAMYNDRFAQQPAPRSSQSITARRALRYRCTSRARK
jgi:DNA polymerase III epsilon subunit-like protein